MVAEILDNIPFPPHKRRGASPKYPWLQLKPGQAFKFAEGISVASAKSMAAQMATGMAFKFAVRQTTDGVYCWRVDGTGWDIPNGNYRQEIPVIEDYADDPAPAITTSVVGYQPRKPEPEREPVLGVTPLSAWAPPIPKTASQLKTEQIIRDRAQALAEKGEEDPI